MQIKATCTTNKYIKLEDFENFQNDNFKQMTKDAFEKLKNAILKHGIFMPIFTWKGRNAIIDGYHRIKVLKELKKDGYKICDIPVFEIDGKSEKDIAEKLLLINSKYARITDEGMHDFVNQFDLDFSELQFEIDLPEINLDIEDNFSEKNKEIDIDELEGGLDCKCPKCGFLFKK